ncbi:galactosylceramide sulfotransferase [Caerostris extrusa]|uniref:Galactosylceramide sulfotransferase n=1 Tax=Caerostris extrusa TaxID=172846 RepID=A0AAV4WIW1_CAEEX|nr:galactosylceramide sulfotransferase [Caerostris extrusa]
MLLYKYFNQRLTDRINEFGREKMAEAVEELKNRTRMWYNVCVQKQEFQSKVLNSKRYFTNRMVMAYVKKKEVNATCDDLTTQEPVFTEKLVYRQRYMFQNQNLIGQGIGIKCEYGINNRSWNIC